MSTPHRTTSSPSTTRPIRRHRLRVLLVACFVAPVVALTSSPAIAGGSAVGLASNTFLVTDLAVQAGTALDTTAAGDPSVPAGVWDQSKTATTTTTASAPTKAVKVKPRVSGKLGLIVNSVAVLGGLAAVWPQGADAPALPSPSTQPGTSFGTDNCMRLVSTFITTGTCAASTSGTTRNVLSFTGTWANAGWSLTGNDYVSYFWTAEATQPTAQSTILRRNTFSKGDTQTTISAHPFADYFATTPVGTKFYQWTAPGIEPEWDGNMRLQVENATRVSTLEMARPGTSLEAAPSTDPATIPRTIRTTARCMNTISGVAQTIIANTNPFTINPGAPTETPLPETEDVKCPAGHWLESGKRELMTEGSTQTVEVGAPYTAPSWVPQQVGDFPDCFPAGQTLCRLSLNKIDVSPRYACDSIPVGAGGHPCAAWATDPARATRYDCTFGTTLVALDRCSAYKESFKKGETGRATSTTTTTTVLPPPAPADGSVDPTPDDTPGLGDCVPSWSSVLNPFWVFKAMSCALAWAFIPNPSAFGWQAFVTQLKARPPFSVVIDLAATFAAVAGGFTGAGDCGIFADFSSDDMDAQISCQKIKATPGFGALYAIVQVGMVSLTAFGMFKMVQKSLGGNQ